MGDNHDHLHENGSREFSDETIRRFLLGGLNESERPLFEQRFITDDGLDARVRLAEFDLADDYAFERLSATHRKLFEQRFLLASDRQHQLKVSKALRDRFSLPAAKSSEDHKVTQRLRELFGLSRPAWRIAFGVLILLILFGTAWLMIKEPRLVRQIANRITPRRSPQRSVQREVNHPINASSPEHPTTPSPMPEHDQKAWSSPAASIVLMPDVSYGNNRVPSVSLPKGEKDIVRLQLVLKLNQPGPYRAELLTNSGQSVFSVDSLPSADSRAQVDFDIPTHLLKAGDYQIRLSRSDKGSKENEASYYFRVQ
jgi:hypothetical protein